MTCIDLRIHLAHQVPRWMCMHIAASHQNVASFWQMNTNTVYQHMHTKPSIFNSFVCLCEWVCVHCALHTLLSAIDFVRWRSGRWAALFLCDSPPDKTHNFTVRHISCVQDQGTMDRWRFHHIIRADTKMWFITLNRTAEQGNANSRRRERKWSKMICKCCINRLRISTKNQHQVKSTMCATLRERERKKDLHRSEISLWIWWTVNYVYITQTPHHRMLQRVGWYSCKSIFYASMSCIFRFWPT